MKKKLLYLDIDGVLNTINDWETLKINPDNISDPNTTNVLNKDKINLLKNYVRKHNFKIVITSSWRYKKDWLTAFKNMVKAYGWNDIDNFIDGQTEKSDHGNRSLEIKEHNNTIQEDFIYFIIDDMKVEHFTKHHELKNIVVIDGSKGLTLEDLNKCKF